MQVGTHRFAQGSGKVKRWKPWMHCLVAVALLVVGRASYVGQEVSQSGLRLTAARPMVDEPVRARHAMVASVNSIATGVGVEILRQGGNAVDAAVAIGAALAVVHPEAGNLGGSGQMLIRMKDGKTVSIDYSGVAPAAATANVPAKELLVGYKSSVVPGTPAGLGMAHDKFGKLSWSQDLEPAYRLAKNGFPASYRMQLILGLQVPVMKQFPESAKVFLHGSDKPLQEGEWVVQPDLAATIHRMQVHGWREFYDGETARLIASDEAAHGGWISAQDLRNYRAEVRQPIQVTYRGYPILTVAPSAIGGISLAVALKVLETRQLPLGSEGSSLARHYQIEALRRGFETVRDLNAGRLHLSLDQLLSPAYIQKLAANIEPGKASPPPPIVAEPAEAKETTDFSVVDGEGNIVTNTYTLSGFYGSQVIAKGTGVLLNDSMSVFSRQPGAVNYLEPHRRYRTAMADTIILNRDGSPWAAFGSPGAATIPSTVLQVVTNLVDFKMSLRDAIEFPRIHYNLSRNLVEAEPGALPIDVAANLEAMGYKLDPRLRAQGDVDAVMIVPQTGWREGCADGRRGGDAEGY